MSRPPGRGRRHLLTSAVANWLGFAAQVVVAFFVSPILVRGLGDQRYGIWSLVESVLAYLMLFDLGVASSIVRYVAKFEACGDRKGLNRTFSTSLCIFAAAGALALAATLGLALLWPRPATIPPGLEPDARWMLALLGANLALGFPLGVFPSVLEGLGRFSAKAAIRTAWLLVRTAAVVALIRQGGGLRSVAVATTLCNLADHLSMAVAVRWLLPGLRFSASQVDRETFRMIRGYSLHSFVAMLSGRISYQTDALVIGAFLAPQHITFFAIAARLVEYAKTSIRSLTGVLTPAISHLEARGEAGTIRRVLLDGTRYVLYLILPIEAGLIILGRPFLSIWMGPRYAEASYPTLAILSAPLFLILSQSVSARVLYGTGRLGWFARATVCEALANLALSVALVRALGIEGVALGTAVPNLFFNLALAAYICRTLRIGPLEYARRAFLKPMAAVLVPASCWLAAAHWGAPASSWASLIAAGSAGLAAYSLAVAALEWGPIAAAALAARHTVMDRGRVPAPVGPCASSDDRP